MNPVNLLVLRPHEHKVDDPAVVWWKCCEKVSKPYIAQ